MDTSLDSTSGLKRFKFHPGSNPAEEKLMTNTMLPRELLDAIEDFDGRRAWGQIQMRLSTRADRVSSQIRNDHDA